MGLDHCIVKREHKQQVLPEGEILKEKPLTKDKSLHDAADASALAILEKIAANGDNSDLDLSDSEDPPDGEEANEQCDEIRDEVEEEDCQYDSDTDVGDGDDGVSDPATPRRERWPRKQAYKSVLPDLPDAPASSADERDGCKNNDAVAATTRLE
ncbi:hypothetical protein HPB50_028660 [Hyalomma asiaticum]|nr:hypothetical protein HPB50_028660 [Hyalomma asiaticum]